MKMYIILKQSVISDNLAPAISAHASLACYLKFKDDARMINWLNNSFKKVVCLATDKEFDLLKREKDYIVTTESALENEEVAITFCPREDYPIRFKFISLYKPKDQYVTFVPMFNK